MFALPGPWSTARRDGAARRLLLLLGTFLYGFGLHAARASCMPAATYAAALAVGETCHGELDAAQAACEAHCRTEVQSSRLTPGFDLPAAVPPDLGASLDAPAPVGPLVRAPTERRTDAGPPLHILLHRLLR
jgi:hypothetical protein